ncbi:unnamed protein product, partial [Polarella glacialis]
FILAYSQSFFCCPHHASHGLLVGIPGNCFMPGASASAPDLRKLEQESPEDVSATRAGADSLPPLAGVSHSATSDGEDGFRRTAPASMTKSSSTPGPGQY